MHTVANLRNWRRYRLWWIIGVVIITAGVVVYFTIQWLRPSTNRLLVERVTIAGFSRVDFREKPENGGSWVISYFIGPAPMSDVLQAVSAPGFQLERVDPPDAGEGMSRIAQGTGPDGRTIGIMALKPNAEPYEFMDKTDPPWNLTPAQLAGMRNGSMILIEVDLAF